MEDLLELNKLGNSTRTEIIPSQSNKTIKACIPLVLMGKSMNVMMEHLHQNDKALPRGLHVLLSYRIYNCGSQKTTVKLYNTKDYAIVIQKGTAVAQMVAANGVLETVVGDGTGEALQTQRWAKESHAELIVEERRKVLFEKLELSGLESWMKENKEKALNLLAEYHAIFTLEDEEMGCTEAAEHKIKVTDLKLFKERPQNIPSGLLEEVKEHLDHMLNVGAIKPSKSAWCNAVVPVWKKAGGLRFCINFQRLNTHTQKDSFPLP